MHFTKLRLAGFKSFVEPTEVAIMPGLTGLVGPNGCGKSNLVEAIRWVMGENSAKRMRGGSMDDVIFSGTSLRPARNFAEVALLLDNQDRAAPASWNDKDEIEVSRRIEREAGSAYSVNGAEVRARDVQLLFADLSTGAHSTALVSQGKVAALIAAKPVDRRAILEEAAGISGLHSRRHEAELRLKGAETNLERVEDVLAQLDTQLQSLKRQARQANRYRNLSGHIRQTEAVMFHLKQRQTAGALAAAEEGLREIEHLVAEFTTTAAHAQVQEAGASEALPPLRQAEAEAAAALHRLAVARDGLEAEEKRALAQQAELEHRLVQIGADTAREESQRGDAAAAIERLDGEKREIEGLRADEAEQDQAAQQAVNERLEAARTKQAELDQLTERAAAEQAQRARLNQQLGDAQSRLQRLTLRLTEIQNERTRLIAEGEDLAASEAASAVVAAAEQRSETGRTALTETEQQRQTAQAAEQVAREAAQKLEGAAGRLAAEEGGLAKLLSVNEKGLWPPMIDALSVAGGYEKALGAAMGDELSAAADSAAPRHWEELPALDQAPALPAGVEPLTQYVRGPAALSRRLAFIGIASDETGARLRRDLAPGQCLVSRSGALWRWDGYTVKAGAPAAATLRLEQRNRLDALRAELAGLREQVNAAQAELATARNAHNEAQQAERAAREAARTADRELEQARAAQAAAIQKAAARQSRLAALQSSEEELSRDRSEAAERLDQATASLAALPPDHLAREAIIAHRTEVEQLRQTLAEARAALDGLRREAGQRARRLEAIAGEHRSWASRAQGAEAQLAALGERRTAAETELAEVAAKPAEIQTRRAALLEQIALAETQRSERADALAAAETALATLTKALREANTALGEAREERVRRIGEAEHVRSQLSDLAERIREALNCTPEQVLAAAEVPANDPLPELPDVERKLERLKRERDQMGPVNLRAELEANEIEQQLNGLQSEKSDLLGAIDRLRQGIGSLNREGRERLMEAFTKVDGHFRQLFTTVFGGGSAQLQLVESEDPLEAGLEILAAPPGKKPQTLSLLSGGEQALTALSLLFAAFKANPAPICVLDEVDAPLDDSNAERVCTLLDDMAEGGTRFIVVTHNPITMARMDRLLGVTMAERGVSTLVTVDLDAARELAEPARQVA